MVRILSNGDIVPDDDERAKPPQSRSSNNDNNARRRQGFVRHEDPGDLQGAGGYQQISIFQSLNQRLRAYGLPSFSVGPYTVEPIVTVGFVLAGLLFGLPGLLLGAVLFLVSMWSQHGLPDFAGLGQGGSAGGSGSGSGSGRGGPSGGSGHRFGGGHRLGRS